MLNTNELSHEYFEELCSLAALGQISTEEYEQLRTHLQNCPACRSCFADFNEILHEHLPLLDSQKVIYSSSGKVKFHDASYRHRFIQRATVEGVRFSEEVSGRRPGSEKKKEDFKTILTWGWKPQVAVAAVLIFGIVIVAMGVQIHRLGKTNSTAQSEISRLKGLFHTAKEDSSLSSRLSAPTHPPLEEVRQKPSLPPSQEEEMRNAALQKELQHTRVEYEAVLSKSKSLESQLLVASNQVSALQNELVSLKEKAGGAEKLNETELSLQQMSHELDRLQHEKIQTAGLLADQQNQIKELNDKFRQQAENLERERELFATSREIRNLMGARSLHIIDVADVDSHGTQRPFGRVFYTEGKSLLFYAYDLDKKKKSLERLSFQAWGQLGTKSSSAQSLGLFQADDQAQNRWVLRCDDPTLLEKIDSVFVTIEPRGGSSRPQGQQLMYAFLKANPNHP